MTLAQVQDAKPTVEYDPMYGATIGLGATSAFIEDLYASLTTRN
jgi:hypothetical protein